MAAYTTTMSGLLTAMKSTLLLYQNTTLAKLKHYQKSVLNPQTVFPALAILPINETYEYGLSNSKYDVTRNISLQVFDLKFDQTQSHDNTVDLIKAVKDIFEDNHTISGTTYSLKWDAEGYGNTIQVGNKFLKRSTLNVSAKSRENFSTMVTTGTCQSNVNPKDLQDRIKTYLVNNKTTYYSTVNTIKDSPIEPIPVLPAVLVGAGYKSRNQEAPAADMSTVYVDVAICTQLFAKETSLNHNLSITEGVKDVLQINHQFGGYCEYSNIENIEYEPEQIDERNFMYRTVINLACKMREYI